MPPGPTCGTQALSPGQAPGAWVTVQVPGETQSASTTHARPLLFEQTLPWQGPAVVVEKLKTLRSLLMPQMGGLPGHLKVQEPAKAGQLPWFRPEQQGNGVPGPVQPEV